MADLYYWVLLHLFIFMLFIPLSDGSWSWQEFIPRFTLGFPSLKQSAWLAGSVFLIMVPFLSGGYYVQENLRRMLINVRKGWSLLLLYLLAALLLPFVNTSDTFENWIMAMVPMAAFHAYTYFYSLEGISHYCCSGLQLLLFSVTSIMGPGGSREIMAST